MLINGVPTASVVFCSDGHAVNVVVVGNALDVGGGQVRAQCPCSPDTVGSGGANYTYGHSRCPRVRWTCCRSLPEGIAGPMF